MRKVLVYLTVLSFLSNSTALLADAFQDAINTAKQDGAAAQSSFTMPQFDATTGDAAYTNQDGTAVTIPQSDMIQNSVGLDARYSDAVGNDANTVNSGTLEHGTLQTENSTFGDAYRTLRGNFDGGINEPPPLANDPIMALSRNHLDPDSFPTDFSACSTNTTWSTGTSNVHIPDIRHCTDVPSYSLNCSLNHTVDVDFIDISYDNGAFSYQSCGTDTDTGFPCIELRIGSPSDNSLSGQGGCAVYNFITRLRVENPNAIHRVQVQTGVWDDVAEFLLNDVPFYDSYPPWDYRTDLEPPLDMLASGYQLGRGCEGSSSHSFNLSNNPAGNLTAQFKSASPGDEMAFRVRVAVGGGGEGFFKVRFIVDPSKMPITENWFSQNCVDQALEIQRNPVTYCTDTVTCEDNLNPSQTCDANSLYCPPISQLDAAPVAGLSKSCSRATVTRSCGFDSNNDCYTNSSGQQVCGGNGASGANYCQRYRDDTSCAFVSSQCASGGYSASGDCIVFTEEYDCGYAATINNSTSNTTIDCAGAPVRCMGNECVDDSSTTSNSFGKLSALFQTAELIRNEGNCNPATNSCEIFSGSHLECKQAISVAGHLLQDCCHDPIVPDDFSTYLKMLAYAAGIDAGLGLGGAEALKSGAVHIYDTSVAAGEALYNSFTGSAESIANGAASEVGGAVADTASQAVTDSAAATAFQGAKQAVMETTKNFLNEKIKNGAGDAIFQAVPGKEHLLQINPGITSVFGAIAAAYFAYQMTKLLASIIWECDDQELELAASRGQKTCHYLGSYCKQELPTGGSSFTVGVDSCIETRQSYCCFSSPLSRILMQQVRLQGVGSWGSAKNPNCSGIPLGLLSDINWDLVDLTEWTNLLAAHAVQEDPLAMSIDTLTGESSNDFDLDPDYTAPNAIDRIVEKHEDADYHDYMDNAEQSLEDQVVW